MLSLVSSKILRLVNLSQAKKLAVIFEDSFTSDIFWIFELSFNLIDSLWRIKNPVSNKLSGANS